MSEPKHLKIQYVGIKQVKPYLNNPRKNDEAVNMVAMSLKEYGWQQPIVVDANMVVIAGHTRLRAAQELGWLRVPIVVATNLTPAKVKAYRIADNRVGELAKWDLPKLKDELIELDHLNFDLPLTGFTKEDMEKLLETEGHVPPPKPRKPRVNLVKVKCPKCQNEFSA